MGLDGLPPEIFTDGGLNSEVMLTNMSVRIWKLDVVLFDWFRWLIFLVYSKGQRPSYEN